MYIATEEDSKSEFPIFSGHGPTSSWFRRFKKRNNLSLRRPENEFIARYDAKSEEIYQDLMTKYYMLMDEHDLPPSQIFNADESEFQMVCKNPRIVTVRGDKKIYVKKSGERSKMISVEVCGNASGTVIIPPFVIFKG